MLKRFLPVFQVLLLLVIAESGAHAQNSFRDVRDHSVAVRLGGGGSLAFGSTFSQSASSFSNFQPFAGAGAMWHFQPGIRAGFDYDCSGMVVQNYFPSLQPFPEGDPLAGSDGGVVYRDIRSTLHGFSATGEYNVLDQGQDNGPERLSLWVGIGAGLLYAHGNLWTLSVADNVNARTQTHEVRLTGHNDPHDYVNFFIPVTVSAEYSIIPQLALSAGLGFRFIPGTTVVSPRGQVYARAGLVFILPKIN